MNKATVTFTKLVQDTQDLSAIDLNQNHMASKAFFTLEVNDKRYPDMSVVLRQPFGTDYTKEPIEVEKPSGSYTGNWNHNAFRDIVEDYYRGAIGRAIGIRGGPNIRMHNNTFEFFKGYQLDIP